MKYLHFSAAGKLPDAKDTLQKLKVNTYYDNKGLNNPLFQPSKIQQ